MTSSARAMAERKNDEVDISSGIAQEEGGYDEGNPVSQASRSERCYSDM